MAPSTNRDSDKFVLRLPDGMRERIAEEAKKNSRSMNSEIVARLEVSLSGRVAGGEPIADATTELIVERVLRKLMEEDRLKD